MNQNHKKFVHIISAVVMLIGVVMGVSGITDSDRTFAALMVTMGIFAEVMIFILGMTMKVCPDCASSIPKAALKCPKCQSRFDNTSKAA